MPKYHMAFLYFLLFEICRLLSDNVLSRGAFAILALGALGATLYYGVAKPSDRV